MAYWNASGRKCGDQEFFLLTSIGAGDAVVQVHQPLGHVPGSNAKLGLLLIGRCHPASGVETRICSKGGMMVVGENPAIKRTTPQVFGQPVVRGSFGPPEGLKASVRRRVATRRVERATIQPC